MCDLCGLEAQPPDRLLNRLVIFPLLPCGICVVKTQVTFASVILGEAKIDCNSFAVAYV